MCRCRRVCWFPSYPKFSCGILSFSGAPFASTSSAQKFSWCSAFSVWWGSTSASPGFHHVKKHSFARCFKTCIFLLTELLCLFLVIIFFPSSFYCSHLVLSNHLFFHLGFLVLLSISYPSSWWSFIDLLSLNITFFTFPFDVAFFALISQCVLYAKREGGSSVCAEIWLLVLPLNSATPATAL